MFICISIASYLLHIIRYQRRVIKLVRLLVKRGIVQLHRRDFNGFRAIDYCSDKDTFLVLGGIF
jgi:hypothetical protein